MFAQLPQECLLMILDYTLKETPTENRGHKEWKKPLSAGEIKMYRRRNILWKQPPFTRVLPLTMISNEMNETFDTNEVWTYLYEKEFRKGVGFKRKPKDAKKMMLDKSKCIIRKRYCPIYEFEKKECESFLTEIKVAMKQIHRLDTAFSEIKPQIKDASKIDDDESMDRLPIIFPLMIKIPEGYVNTWGHVSPNSAHITLDQALRDRIMHQRRGTQLIKKKQQSKQIIEKIERIIEKIDRVPCWGVPCSAHIAWVPSCNYCRNY